MGIGQSALGETGIVAWKEQPFHADATAKVFYFDRLEATGPVTWFHQGDRRKGFEPGQAYDMIVLPKSLEELSSKTGTDELKSEFTKLSAFAKRYPAAGAMLKARLDQMRAYLDNNEQGEINVGGKWVPVSQKLKPSSDPEASLTEPAPGTGPSYVIEAIVIGTVYLVILMLLTLWRKRTLLLMFLLLPFLAGFGWRTYQDRGIGWVKEIPDQMRELYERYRKK